MKRVLMFFFTTLLVAVTFFSSGQVVDDTSRFSETIWSMKKKKMVMEYMDLSEAEKASFWPLYESFYQTIRYIEMESLEIMDVYHRAGKTMKPSDVEKYTNRILLNDLLLAKVRKQYYKKFSKALSPDRATQFMHFDNMMRMVLRLEADSSEEPETGLAKASL